MNYQYGYMVYIIRILCTDIDMHINKFRNTTTCCIFLEHTLKIEIHNNNLLDLRAIPHRGSMAT